MAFTRGVGPAYGSDSGVGSVAATLNGTTAGRSLVITVQWGSSTITISSITISGESNATVIAGSLATNATTPYRAQQAYLANITTGGNKTVTVTFSGSPTSLSVGVMEYAGGNTSDFAGAAQPGNANIGAPSVSLTTGTANALIVATCMLQSAEPTAGTGYTLWGTRPNPGWQEEDEDDLDAGAAGAKTVDFGGGTGEWVLSAVEYKLASAAGAVAPTVSDTVTTAEDITLRMHLGAMSVNEAVTAAESITMHMPIHLRMEKLS